MYVEEKKVSSAVDILDGRSKQNNFTLWLAQQPLKGDLQEIDSFRLESYWDTMDCLHVLARTGSGLNTSGSSTLCSGLGQARGPLFACLG
jgi:hypothetical protein